MARLTFLLIVLALGACSSTTSVDEIRQSADPLAIEDGDTLVLLGRHDAGHYVTDTNFVNCVAGRMEGIDKLGILEEPLFVDELFPWFEPRTAPKTLKRMKRILSEPLVAKKIEELNLKYLVWMDGHTENIDQAGSLSCAVGVGGAGCFGLLSWNKLSFYEAVVWNLAKMKEEGRVRVDSEGTNYVLGALVPIPLLTQSKGDACIGMGKQLRQFFETES